MNKDLLAYLVVLGHEPVLARLSANEIEIGRQNMMGCLIRIVEHFEKKEIHDFGESVLYYTIKQRERFNNNGPSADLDESTATCAERIYSFYRRNDFTN